jgi:drug/metabolite transporter (DMT)-like permease
MPLKSRKFSPVGHDITKAFIVWLGGAVIGMIPLLTHSLLESYSKQASEITIQTFYAELCIVAIVVSGLSLLQTIPYGPRPRRAPFTAWTYLVCLATLLSLIYGAMFYAVAVTDVGMLSPTAAWYTLIAAIGGSLGIVLERAILESENG